MSALDLEDLLDRIRPEASRCPVDLMKQRLLDVTRDFCDFTRAYIHEGDDSVSALVSDYDLDMPSSQVQPIAVEFLQVDGTPSVFKDMEWLDRNILNWRLRSADDYRYFTQLQPLVITFPCVPTRNGTVGGMQYRVSVKPMLDATTLDEVFVNEWLEALSEGTLAKLKAIPDEPWSSEKRAAQLQLSYNRARVAARIRVSKSYGNAEQDAMGGRRFA